MRFVVILFLIYVFIGVESRPSLEQEAYEDDEEAEDTAEEANDGTPMLGVVFEDEAPKGSDNRGKQITDERAPRSSKLSKQPQDKIDTSTDVLYDAADAPAGADSNKNTGISDQRFQSEDDIRFPNGELFKNKHTRNRQDDVFIGKRTVGNKRFDAADETSFEKSAEFRQKGNAEQMEEVRSNFNGRRYVATEPEAKKQFYDMFRGRRDIQISNKEGSAENSTVNEDEEAVIKRHVKKLSKEELEELFQSLSDDKKYLLKKIMESNAQDLDNLEKREITKKEGAAGLIDSFPLGNSKFLNGFNTFFTATPSDTNSDKTDKDTAGDSVTVSSNSDPLNQISPELDRINSAKITSNSEQTTVKIDIKRDVRNDYMPSDEPQSYFNEDEESFNDQEEDTNIEADARNDNINVQKRDASYSRGSASDTVGSLQDSFPNFNNCDESDNPIASNMEPLVRVKRTEPDVPLNHVMHNPSSKFKVAFCPLRDENSEDKSESNEFENEIAENSDITFTKTECLKSEKPVENTVQNEPSGTETQQRTKEDAAQNESKLGSDSDAVLSGVEQVDENLMYGNIEQDIPSDSDDQLLKHSRISRSVDDEVSPEDLAESVKAERPRNDQSFQENEAFGALPRSYEGELARYKRIRRVKEHPNKEMDK